MKCILKVKVVDRADGSGRWVVVGEYCWPELQVILTSLSCGLRVSIQIDVHPVNQDAAGK